MGDTLLATPLIRDFKRVYPDCRVVVAAETVPAQALENNPHIDEIVIAPPRGRLPAAYCKLIMQLRRFSFKVSIDLISTPASAAIGYFTRARHRFGYNLRGRAWAYTTQIERMSEPIYNPLTKYRLAAPLGITPSSALPEIYPSGDHFLWVENQLKGWGIDPKKQVVIGLAPWSRRPWRRWPVENWKRLVEMINLQRQFNWILFAAPSERPLLADIESAPNSGIFWAGTDHLLQAAALMAKCRLVLCSEAGLKHIATAVSVPTFTIYREYPGVNPASWTPPDPRHHDLIVDLDPAQITLAFQAVTDFIDKSSAQFNNFFL